MRYTRLQQKGVLNFIFSKISGKSFLFALLLMGSLYPNTPTYALDINNNNTKDSMFEAFKVGRQALKSGDYDEALSALQYAAENGHVIARWKLGKMYAQGEGVVKDEGRAFHYFASIADEYAEISPHAKFAPVISDSFYQSANYLLYGIPEANIEAQPLRAKSMLAYASSYFRNDKAQFLLGKIYAEGLQNFSVNMHMAIRWLVISARNQNPHAQLYLGEILLTNPKFSEHKQEGLVWIDMAKRRLGYENPDVIRALAIAKSELGNDAIDQSVKKPKRTEGRIVGLESFVDDLPMLKEE